MDKKEKKQKKSKKKFKSKDEQIKEIQDQLKSMIEDMKVVAGDNAVDDKLIKIVTVKPKKNLLFKVIEVLISIVSLIALIGYIEWVKSEELYQIFIFVAAIILIEGLLNYICGRFFIKLIFYSFGTITILPSLIAFVISILCSPGITLVNIWRTILVYILYLVIKKVSMYFIRGNKYKISKV